MSKAIQAVYIHIPFCHQICSYCDFPKLFYQPKWINRYLQALQTEIRKRYHHEKITTLYIGGGTPTCLALDELEHLFKILTVLKKEVDYEYTIEANMEDLTPAKVALLARYGINRVSIGVQTFHLPLLNLLHRQGSYEVLKEKIDLLRKYQITNINLDFMYALPGETLAILKHDIDLALSLKVPHFSFYALILEEHTQLFNDNIAPIAEEVELQMYHFIWKTLKEHGYDHYETSNYAKPGYASRHNLTYWQNAYYYGFGLGASGYYPEVRYTNTRNIILYMQKKFQQEKEILTKQDQMSYFMILGLRKTEGISKREFFNRYQERVEDVFPIASLLTNHKLEESNGYLKIPPAYFYVSNEILLTFIP